MKKIELVYREILYQAMENGNKQLTQAGLAKSIIISLSTVNHALKPLRKMGAIRIKLRNFEVVDTKKILFYWASIRNIEKDIIYKTRAIGTAVDMEKNMPGGIVFGAYSAYKFKFKKTPSDYSEVYVYADDLEELKKRFPENNNIPNMFVLKKSFGDMTMAQIFVDLWNLKEWYAKEFLKEMEERMSMLNGWK